MIEQLLKEEREALNAFFDKVDVPAFEEIVSLIEACKGKLVLTGVGKSGLVAKKSRSPSLRRECRAHSSPPRTLFTAISAWCRRTTSSLF